MGERIAFLYGWQSLLVMDPGIMAALATGMSQYLVVLWPAAKGASAGGDGRHLGAGAVNMAGLS